MKITRRMIRRSNKIFTDVGKYLALASKNGYPTSGGIWISDDRTGEIVVFAPSVSDAKDLLKFKK